MPDNLNLDDVLLHLHDEFMLRVDRTDVGASLFADLEAERILEAKIRFRNQGAFTKVCQDLGYNPQQIDALAKLVKWT